MSRATQFPLIGVIADDLAGASISGSMLRARGLRTVVVSIQDRWPETPEAIVVNVGTRVLVAQGNPVAQDGASRVEGAARRMRAELRCSRVELRVDASLRRDYSHEVQGLIRGASLDSPIVLAVPAYPTAGRMTRQGRQISFSTSESDRDVDAGVRLFGEATYTSVSVDLVRKGAHAVARAVVDNLGIAHNVLADAESQEDLRVLAEAALLLERSRPIITLSSGGWLAFHPVRSQTLSFVLVTMGLSTRPNDAQLDELLETGSAVLVDAEEAIALSIDPMRFGTAVAEHDTIVIKGAGDAHDDRDRLDAAAKVARAAEAILTAAHRLGVRCQGIVGTGDFTASMVVRELRVGMIHPLAEVAPLCSLGLLSGGQWTGLPMIMKGGRVGSSRTLCLLVEYLRGGDIGDFLANGEQNA